MQRHITTYYSSKDTFYLSNTLPLLTHRKTLYNRYKVALSRIHQKIKKIEDINNKSKGYISLVCVFVWVYESVCTFKMSFIFLPWKLSALTEWNRIRFLSILHLKSSTLWECLDKRVPIIGTTYYCLISSISDRDWLKSRKDSSCSQASAVSWLP